MFDVYVEGATGTSLGAVRELANAMATRYGVPAADVHARLNRGRFRVKADLDRATAEAYLRDLESIGARARIEPATGRAADAGPRPGSLSLPPQPGQRSASSSLPPQPGQRSASSSLPPQPPSRSSAPLLPPQPAARPSRSSLPPPSPSRPTRSSLSPPSPARSTLPPPSTAGSTRSSEPPSQTLGALERSGLLALATLDDEPAMPSPSDGVMPASMGPAMPRTPTPRSSRNAPIDPFAPPEASAAEQLLELADDEVAHRARRRASAPPAVAAEPPGGVRGAPGPSTASSDLGLGLSAPDAVVRRPEAAQGGTAAAAAAMSAASAAPVAWPGASGTSPRSGGWSGLPGLGSSRGRFVVGVLLAIVLGFVPANLVAGWRERSAYAAIDDQVAAAQSAADAPDSYAALDAFRAAQLDAKRSARRTIVVTAMLIWAAVGGAVAYVWFRRMPRARDARRSAADD